MRKVFLKKKIGGNVVTYLPLVGVTFFFTHLCMFKFVKWVSFQVGFFYCFQVGTAHSSHFWTHLFTLSCTSTIWLPPWVLSIRNTSGGRSIWPHSRWYNSSPSLFISFSFCLLSATTPRASWYGLHYMAFCFCSCSLTSTSNATHPLPQSHCTMVLLRWAYKQFRLVTY